VRLAGLRAKWLTARGADECSRCGSVGRQLGLKPATACAKRGRPRDRPQAHQCDRRSGSKWCYGTPPLHDRRDARDGGEIGRPGSQYAWTARDADGNPLDGGKNYKLHLPPNIPVKDFWSVILYSNQTRSMTQTDQRFPNVSSQTKGLLINPDGSVDVYFGATAQQAKRRTGCRPSPVMVEHHPASL
jgi:Protein of unknown function (DUF1214)